MDSHVAGSTYGSQIRKSHIVFSSFSLMKQVCITPVVAIKYRSVFPTSSTAYTAVSVPFKDLFPQRLELVRFNVLLILLIEGFFLFSLFSFFLSLGGIPLLLNVLNASQVIENQNLFIFIPKMRMSKTNRLKDNEHHAHRGTLVLTTSKGTGTSTLRSTNLVFSIV